MSDGGLIVVRLDKCLKELILALSKLHHNNIQLAPQNTGRRQRLLDCDGGGYLTVLTLKVH